MTEELETGLVLMMVGMGTVFVLLATLVLVVRAVSAVSRRFGGLPTATPAAASGGLPAPPAPDAEIATVIGAAVSAYRRKGAPK
jgi:oxaloacetate decarboxylase (Na+ extruding) subunit gamma